MNFDEAAKSWDSEPRRITRAAAIAERLLESLEPAAGWPSSARALDLGCGTGLLSFLLRDGLAEIVLIDTSAGMIEALGGKIARDDGARLAEGRPPGAAMRPALGDIGSLASGIGTFDLAYSMMALHHIADTLGTLRGLASVLRPGGLLRLVDLDAEDGSFHSGEEGFDGHAGFDRGALGALAEAAGFSAPGFETVWIERRGSGDAAREYPMFLLSARRLPTV